MGGVDADLEATQQLANCLLERAAPGNHQHPAPPPEGRQRAGDELEGARPAQHPAPHLDDRFDGHPSDSR